jgi:uncharacterized protein (TIGR02145 family)
MRQKDLKYFGEIQSGRLNSDDSPFAITTNEWVNAENVRTGTTDKGETGIVESIGGNVLLNPTLPTVTIGEQEWCTSNLNVTTYKNGDPITEITDSVTWAAATYGAYCYYQFNQAGYQQYGKLYNWYAISDPRGLAPDGYHIPTKAEYDTLIATLGGLSVSGGALKETGTTHWNSPNTGATNSSQFTAWGGGQIDDTGASQELGTGAFFWTATVDTPGTDAYNVFLRNNSAATAFATNNFNFGFSVRLLKDTDRYITIGAVEDTENERLVYFNYDKSVAREDKIVCIYAKTNTIYDVLLSSQVEGGLNFDKYSLIHSAKITGNLLSWSDGTNNEPRKININSGIVTNHPSFVTDANPYSFPLNFWEITVIKPPPIYCPNISLTEDSNFINNFIATNSFEFAFQYQYYDNEVTVPSSYSVASRLGAQASSINLITIQMDGNEVIPNTVRRVNLVARQTDGTTNGGNDAFVIKTWDKESQIDLGEIDDQNAGGQVLTYSFYNNISGQYLAPDDVLRPFDDVPIYSQTHEVAKSRYFFGNNTVGYDTPTETSLGVALASNGSGSSTTVTLQVYKIEMKTYEEIAGNRSTPPAKQWAYSAYAVFDGQNYLVITSTQQYTLNDTIIPVPTAYTSPVAYTSTAFYNVGFNASQRITKIYPQTLIPRPPGNTTCDGATYVEINTVTLQANSWVQIANFPTVTYNVWAQQSPYKFGVVFYDYAMRKCGVVAPRDTDDYTEIFSYFPSGSLSTNIQGTSPDIITTSLVGLGAVQVGDRIEVIGSSFDGTYDVVGLVTRLNQIAVSQQTIPTAANITGITINVYRRLTTNVTTPTASPLSAINTIKWSLSNTSAVDEIPDWAYYYTVVRTLNLRTRYFIQNYVSGNGADSFHYCTRNALGVWDCTHNTVVPGVEAIALPTTSLIHNGLGYVYDKANEDVCILQTNGVGGVNPGINLPVIGQDGGNILIKFVDLGNSPTAPVPPGGIAGLTGYYEIFTPYKTTEQEAYYEVGEIYAVTNPTEPTREYSALQGNFRGDCALVERNPSVLPASTFKVLGMCANDLYFQRWDNDGGKVNVVTKFGRSVWGNYVYWSDAVIEGSQINGTSTFRLGSNTSVPSDCGTITKLQLTSKVQNEGTVMLGLCAVETTSMYLGETQILDSTGKTQFFSSGTSVVGTINVLKGNYGCVSPESVVQYRGRVYYFDANYGRWVQYSENGLDAISSIKMVRFWKNWAYQYLSMTKEDIEEMGDRPYVFATVDSAHDELLISIPKLSETPPKGFLPDYPEEIYPFDILDLQGKTIVYKLGTGAVVVPHWQGAYMFNTEYFGTLQNKLFSFKSGMIYEHNQPNQNTWYGVYSPSKIMFTSNILPQVPKVYDNFLSESNLVPNFVYFYNSYPYLQTSDLETVDFRDVEGIWYASILRNKVVPTVSGDVYTGLLTAEVMRNTNMYVLVEYSPTTEVLQLRILELGMSISKGHTV